MPNPALEERVSELEKKVAHLMANPNQKDWRRSLGMFTGDEIMKQIDEEGRKIREKDRREARKLWSKNRRRVKK
jgi:hypothetical protein